MDVQQRLVDTRYAKFNHSNKITTGVFQLKGSVSFCLPALSNRKDEQ